MADIQGTCDPRFSKMRDLLSATIDSGDDLGASSAVTVDGELVVDLWGGWKDAEKTAPWERDTITNVWSTTKTMTSIAALVVASRGELDVHAPVAKYWPEFAANGKEAIEVRHLMSHTSGVSGWAQPVVAEDVYDWEKSTSMLAAQAPWWEPGTASGYHALNQGHLVGEVIRRITGMQLGKFFAKEVAAPLGADFHIGLDPAEFHRISNVIPPPPIDMAAAGPIDPESPAFKTFTGPPLDATLPRTEAWRRADIGAANGHGNARSVARVHSMLACGGEVDGIRLISPEACDLIFEEQSNGIDVVIGQPLRFGIGFGLPHDVAFPYVPKGRVCYWGGWGGSIAIIDLDRRMTISYMMNRMVGGGIVGDTRGENLVRAAYAAAGA
ncbi:serine hydrolase [bacterium SCGC AG-212-C10]|nr:serine hydrolase [bacterium SCGC AG-212-C10]